LPDAKLFRTARGASTSPTSQRVGEAQDTLTVSLPMKPASFNYLQPKSIEEAVTMLNEYGDDARILAGGQSLVPVLNFRLSRFEYLVDIGRIAEMTYIRVENDELKIGALTTYRRIETSELVRIHAPLLANATKFVAHLPIRTRGTIGGSLANADPSAEYPAIMMALDGLIVVRGARGQRAIAAGDFFRGLFTTALEPGEIVVEVRIPFAKSNQVFGFQEFTKRPGDLALVGVAAAVDLADGVIADARLAIFGVADGAQRMRSAEAVLRGKAVSPDLIERASQCAEEINTQTDLHATSHMRTRLATVLTKRSLRLALMDGVRCAT
jgi:CO/xanthine dehydrogenase FAD-binding subunit